MRQPSETPELDRSLFPWLVLVAATVLIGVHASNYLQHWPALGDDASSHTATIGTLASRMLEGRGWWSTDYNLGFPMALYYQPLPHIVSGVFCAALGGPAWAGITYKLFMSFMILVQPWAIYLGLRRAGADRLHAAFVGALAPCIMNGLNFGYTTFASLKVGLYTQAWGNVMLPLALGELIALVSRRGRLWTSMVACAALATCHMFFAVAIVIPVGVFALLWPWLEESAGTGANLAKPATADAAPPDAGLHNPAQGATSLHASERGSLSVKARSRHAISGLASLTVVGIGTGLILSAWFLPLLRTRAFMGGWPFGNSQHVNGFGFTRVWQEFVTGKLLDGASRFSEVLIAPRLGLEPANFGWAQFPVMTALALLAIPVVLLQIRRRPIFLFSAIVLVWSTLGAIGRTDIGPVFDWYPLHRSVEIFRYSSMIQFSAMLFSAYGFAFLVRGLTGEKPAGPSMTEDAPLSRIGFTRMQQQAPMLMPAVVVGAILLIHPFIGGSRQLATGFRTLAENAGLDEALHAELGQQIAALPKEGRLLVGPKTEVRFHFHGGLLTWLGQRPAGQSYGVGLHDSLGFYMLEFINLQSTSLTPVLMDLYDYRFVVRKPDHALAGMTANEVVWENETYSLEAIPGEHQAAMLMREAGVRHGEPRAVRETIRRWLNGNGPSQRTTWVLETDDGGSGEYLVGSPVTVRERDDIEGAAPPAGEVLQSRAYADELYARVSLDEPALLVFKMGYHPFWQVEVNGTPAEGVYAYPMFLAVRLPAGEHEVQARYRWPASSRWLLSFIPLMIGGAAFADARLRRWRDASVL